MFRSRLFAWCVGWPLWLLGSVALAQPPSAAEVPAPPEPSEPAAPAPPSAPEPPELDTADDAPPPPSAAEVDADPNESELVAQADLRAPPEPLGPPEPVPPPVPITTETVNAPPLPPDPASDPDGAFPPAPPPNVEGQPLVAPPPSAAELPAPASASPTQPAAASEKPSSTAPEPPQFRVGALAGVGVTFDHTVGGINPLGFGFGLRGDYLLDDAWRVGARTLYFVGGHSELPTGTVEMSSWLLAVEGAYAIDVAPITLEPGLALGFFERERGGPPLFASQSASYIPGSQHHVLTGFYLAPGISGYLPLGELDRELDLLFVGLDARFDLVFSSSVSANLQLLCELGLRF